MINEDEDAHARLQEIFTGNLQASTSEIHGILSGLICACAVPESPRALLRLMAMPEEEIENEESLDALLRDMLANIHQQLHRDDFSFAPLVPGDNCDLTQRTEELAEWCSGFMLGLSHGDSTISNLSRAPCGARVEENGDQDDDGNQSVHNHFCAEALRDIASLSEARHDAGEENNDEAQAEMAFLELYEHIKLCVQMIYEEGNTPD